MENEQNIESSPQEITSDERLFVLLSHLSFFFGGLVVSIVIYVLQKDKNKFVAFNALEAAYFQASYLLFAGIIIGGSMVGLLGGMGIIKDSVHQKMSSFIMGFFSIFFLLTFLVLAFFGTYSIIAGIKSYQGQIKKYPMVGNMAYRQVYGG